MSQSMGDASVEYVTDVVAIGVAVSGGGVVAVAVGAVSCSFRVSADGCDKSSYHTHSYTNLSDTYLKENRRRTFVKVSGHFFKTYPIFPLV